MDYSFFLILMVVLSFIIFIRVPRRPANLFINYILRLITTIRLANLNCRSSINKFSIIMIFIIVVVFPNGQNRIIITWPIFFSVCFCYPTGSLCLQRKIITTNTYKYPDFFLHSFFFILSFLEEIEQIELDDIIKEEGNYNSSKWNH